MRTKLLQTFGVGIAFGIIGCSAGDAGSPAPGAGDTGNTGDTGGANTAGGTGSTNPGGTAGSGNSSGGATGESSGAGGASSGGASSGSAGRAGASSGGASSNGGAANGGAGRGGASSAGASAGGAANGGAGRGGASSGGASNGGASSGGAAHGGASSGGATSSGGSSGSAGAGGGTTAACDPGSPGTGGTVHTSNSTGNAGNGYTYQYWSNGTGSGSMTVFGQEAKFSSNWTSVGDFLARVGLTWNSTKTPTALGTVTATFSETKSGGNGGFSYIGIYGWSENPLHEYYIVEDWFGSRPVPGTKMGTITVDGGTYDVLTHTQTNQPAITGGNATFVQFWSVRQTARTCGTISISEHFSKWAAKAAALALGNMEEASILMEAGGNSGSINFTTATVTLN